MDFLWCSCRTWWCCGMCVAFVHPVEDHDAEISLPNGAASDCGVLLTDPNVAGSTPAALCAPGEISFEEQRNGTCEKLEPSQSSFETIHQHTDENELHQDTAIDIGKLKQETDEAERISQKPGEVEDNLKEYTLASIVDDEDICPTCLDGYDSENPRIITACGHHFHLGCILEWAERRPTCPVCDKEMLFSETF